MGRKPNFSLEGWIDLASHLLAPYAKKRIADEINAHYQSIVDQEQKNGKSEHEAHEHAMAALGSPYDALKDFRKAYLTREQYDNVIRSLEMVMNGFPKYFYVFIVAFSIFLSFTPYSTRADAVVLCATTYVLFHHILPRTTRFFLRRKNVRWAVGHQTMLTMVFIILMTHSTVGAYRDIGDVLFTLSYLSPAIFLNYRIIRKIPNNLDWKSRDDRHV